MERLSELISKLKEQFEQNADHSKLLVTTLLIERELMKAEQAQTRSGGESKIAVVMPADRNGYFPPVQETITETPAGIEEEQQTVPEPPPAKEESQAREFAFDPLIEIPTLSQQHSTKEINEMLGSREGAENLNDKLKEQKVEIGQVLKEHPIRDLKKAIGINDRFVFINELFRGDEVMYERSLKTIDSFRLFAEAEYWIERELKVKLGWEEHKETTRQFYQLVRRRFS